MATDGLTQAALEALGAARTLVQEVGGPLSVVLAGPRLGEAPAQAIHAGAETVFTVESPMLEGGPPDALVAVAERAVNECSPWAVLGSKSPVGSDVVPRLAFRLGRALAQDCVSLALDSAGRLLATRPVHGGNIMATVACMRTPAVASLRPGAFAGPELDSSRQGHIESLDPCLDGVTVRARVLERVEGAKEGVRLQDAAVVVGGGRGLGGPEAFQHLEELATMLRGAVGASRAAADAGWVPAHYQIGLTGQTISPDLYIAVGISGASQHMAGCGGAKQIVAINSDLGANIFQRARLGVAGDWRKVLPAFIDQLRELL